MPYHMGLKIQVEWWVPLEEMCQLVGRINFYKLQNASLILSNKLKQQHGYLNTRSAVH